MIDVIQFQSGTLQDAGILLASVAVVQLISECLLLFTGVKLSNYELAFDLHFQEQILKKVSTLSCKDFENNRTYDLVNRTQYDADAGILGSIKTFFSLAASLISSVSFAVIIAKFNIILFVIIIVIPNREVNSINEEYWVDIIKRSVLPILNILKYLVGYI